MNSTICTPNSLLSYTPLKPNSNSNSLCNSNSLVPKRPSTLRFTPRASLSVPKETILKSFHERRALKIISGLQNFNKDNVASVVTAADKVEIGNYDSFYESGIVFSPDQAKLAEQLEQEGVDIIQTEGGKCSNPSKSGVLGLIEKATPTLAAAYSISRAVKIPVMCASGLSAVTAPMAITAGAAGVGVGSAINKLNDVVAMIAEVRSIADSLGLSVNVESEFENREKRLKLDDGNSPETTQPQATDSFSSSPIYFDNQPTNTSSTLHSDSIEQPPQEFLSYNDLDDFAPRKNPPLFHDSENKVPEISSVDDIDSMIRLLGLSDSDGKRPEMPYFGDYEFYEKIVQVKGPKCRKEVERLDGWIKYLLNNGRREPLRLAHLLLAKAAFVSDGKELEFPSTIDEFLQNDPPKPLD
ncbi:Aldolase-type TIM barrel [Cynara cardunculus var. scolymus]|uniref:Uncharacterized protein ycf23 n=1 Tax=Cynara cardunculus var. scolymus TaxID=59895 RepID=A0A103XV44_CYNCS|nr:Aldolase-type TIM barrel [Cynara cardunculus var. scolymus]